MPDSGMVDHLIIMLEEAGSRPSPFDAIAVITTYLSHLSEEHAALRKAALEFTALLNSGNRQSAEGCKHNEFVSVRKATSS